jgi:hypothetical protein
LAFDLDYDRLWQRAQRSAFMGVPCLHLSPNEELLLLCLHGAKEQWEKLKWVADIAAFLEAHPAIDWQGLYAEAAQQGCARMLDLGLVLAARLLDSPLPAETAERLRRDRATTRLAAETIARLARDEAIEPGPYRLSRYYWRMRERPRDRLAYALRTLFTPRAPHYGRLPLPAGMEWAYYLLKLPWDYLLTPVLGLGRSFWKGGLAARFTGHGGDRLGL